MPRLTVAAWLFVLVTLVLSQLGTVLQLDQWMLDVSPFTHLPKLPAGRARDLPDLARVHRCSADHRRNGRVPATRCRGPDLTVATANDSLAAWAAAANGAAAAQMRACQRSVRGLAAHGCRLYAWRSTHGDLRIPG